MPFDEDWNVKVNDADAKLYSINAGLTGLLINKGNNKVELTFEPRLKKLGLSITLCGLIILMLLLAFKIYIDRKNKLQS